MKSGYLSKRGFGAWRPFSRGAERILLNQLPTTPGVYSMRFTREESRLRGESDIAYVGKATNRNGLRGRIRQYFHPGWRQSTNLAMKDRLDRGLVLEFAYVATRGGSEAANLESELLLAFESEHGERPPFNRQAALSYLRSEQSGAGAARVPAASPVDGTRSSAVVRTRSDRSRMRLADIESAHEQIRAAAKLIVRERGQSEFRIREVIDLLREAGSRYKSSTVRTHIASRCCEGAPENHAVRYADFDRIGRGVYRVR